MASPFTVFRKHRKAFLAGLTIMTMFGFVFIPMILDNIRIDTPKDPVMVTTKKYGKLKQSDVYRMVEQRRRVADILKEARRTALLPEAAKQLQAMYGKFMDAEMIQGQAQRAADQEASAWVARHLGEASQESVVNSWLMARRAEEIGMSVTDDTVNQFLKQTSRGRAGDDLWQQLLDRHHLTDKQFFALLRTELLGIRFGELFGPSVGATTPAQRWDYFTRLKQEATIEALPIRVADYIGQVEDPDEAALRAFFEQHRNDYDLSTSPRPGFRQPERVNVRYFRLVPSQIEKSVSAAAVSAYIEKNKAALERRYEAAHKKPEEKKTEEKKTEEKKTEEGKPEVEKPEGTKTEEKKIEEEGKTEEKKAEERKTDPEAKEPAKEADAMEPEPKEPAKELPKEPEADKTSVRSAVGGFQFAAFLQEGAEDDKTAEKTAGKTEEKTAEKPDEKPPEKPEDKPPAKGEEKTEDKKTEEEKPAAKGEEKPAGEPKEKTGDEPGKEKKPDAALEPLIPEVIKMTKQQWIEDAARKELAGEQYRAAVDGLQSAIRAWAVQQRDFEARTRRARPEPLNFQALAAKFGATTDETGLLSPVEMFELEIARSSDERRQGFMSQVFADRGESQRAQLSKYQVGVTHYQGGAAKTLALPETITYVFYKTEDRPEEFPAWEDEGIAELALKKWKQVEARKLAFREAEALAKKARGSETALKEIFPDRKVVTSGPFSWMTEGVAARLMGPSEPPTLSKPEGIERPGDDFMRTVFTLPPGGVGVAMNRPETVAYVIRLERLERSDESLWTSFELTPPGEYGSVANDDVQQVIRAWIDQIKADASLKWEIPPDQPVTAGNAQK